MNINYKEILNRKCENFQKIQNISEDNLRVHEVINRTIDYYEQDLNWIIARDRPCVNSIFMERCIFKLDQLQKNNQFNHYNTQEAFKDALEDSRVIFDCLNEVVSSIPEAKNREDFFKILDVYHLACIYSSEPVEAYLNTDLTIALYMQNRKSENTMNTSNAQNLSLSGSQQSSEQIEKTIDILLRSKHRFSKYTKENGLESNLSVLELTREEMEILKALNERSSLIIHYLEFQDLTFQLDKYLDKSHTLALDYVYYLLEFSYLYPTNTSEMWKSYLENSFKESVGIEEIIRLDNEIENAHISPETNSLSHKLKRSLKVLRSRMITDDESVYKNETTEYQYNIPASGDTEAVQQIEAQKNKRKSVCLKIVLPICTLVLIVTVVIIVLAFTKYKDYFSGIVLRY